ncbi:hypothetical protein P7C71_g3227, partial [Lecanoromycetidae sp. Uapishka_2]
MDVAGSVVSIVALTLQIGDKVQQIHDFWHSFKHASAEVQQIVEDLDAFDDLLAAGPRSNASPDPSVLKILKRCDAKVDTLRQHVATLEPGFKSTKAVSRSLVRAGNADLIKDTAALRSEQSGLISTVTSVETQTQDLKKHVADVHKGLQKIARQNEAQANLAVGHFAAGPLGQMMQTAVDQALDKSGLRDFMKGITKGTESRGSEPLPESHDVGTQSDEFCNGPSHPSPQCSAALHNNSALCDFLIKAGANPDAVTDRGETGRLRSDRPQGLLLSNLTSKKSQERYKQGKIRIKVEADGDDAKSPHQESAHEKALHHFYSFMSDYSDEGSDEQLDDDFIDATSEDSDDDNETVMWTAEEGHLDFEESEADEDFEDAVEVLA